MIRQGRIAAFCLAVAAAAVGSPLQARDEAPSAEGAAAEPSPDGEAPRARVTPYIEADQVALAELSPGNDVVTYSVLAAGLDAGVRGRNSQGSISLRYERRFGWGKSVADGDTISGIGRIAAAVIPHALSIEAGALAARSRVESSGITVPGAIDIGDAVTQVYSVYAGPTLSTQSGEVKVDGSYRVGYTRVESPRAALLSSRQPTHDLFDDSVTQSAALHAATRPGDPLPVGLGVGAGWNREDISVLDQRVEDFHARGDVTVPVSGELALVGGIGWEDVEISSRDALRDANGAPVIGSDGRFVTDKGKPRTIAYDVSGLIWDTGVIWRPSRRTAFEAHVGRRYGSTSYYGTFAYAPNSRSSLNLSVYDSITGFGGLVNSALVKLPTEFEAVRNPLSGDLGGCVAGQSTGAAQPGQASCLAGVLGSVRSAAFRSRGVMATYGIDLGRLQAGIGAGHDRRKFIAAPGIVLASSNGVVDENTWLAAYLNGRVDQHSRFSATLYANWHQSRDALSGDVTAVGATAAYYRSLAEHLSAHAAIGIDGISRGLTDDIWSASALVGLRYSF